MSNNAEKCKAYRAKLARKGKCVWGCGKKSSHPCGLCDCCYDKNNEKNKARYHRNKKLKRV